MTGCFEHCIGAGKDLVRPDDVERLHPVEGNDEDAAPVHVTIVVVRLAGVNDGIPTISDRPSGVYSIDGARCDHISRYRSLRSWPRPSANNLRTAGSPISATA